ncbi:hypothetical protein KIH74_21995 [Kineosporia sp. J2-2]|uniref:VOC domain-containing protein n=1 Tax=Kineosporia corallincola TaxID=2835133 RepID=A0ABS5TKJ8_9ACTN|nr:VOC family protein [Kineosporia corallincola]MBT0771627.1 hypothetical protein [Kineosporia corallincola]
MSVRLAALCIDAHDPVQLAAFWAGLLGWRPAADPAAGADHGARRGIVTLVPREASADPGFRLRFLPTTAPRTGPNQMHFDLTSETPDHQRRTVNRALGLGARHLDVGQGPDATQVVLADPEGNEMCVIEAGNRFLAGCGFIGALSGDGSPETGRFWSQALGWPLVWDQDEETAIRSPHGGPKITWGGPPYRPRAGKERVHLDLVTAPGDDLRTEVERLTGLGAALADIGQGDVPWVVMADPDGHEFCLLPG